MPRVDWVEVFDVIADRAGNISEAELARIFGCERSTILRGLRRFNLRQEKAPPGRKQSQKKVLIFEIALFFWGLNRDKIEKLLGTKSEKITEQVLGLTSIVPAHPVPQRQLNPSAINALEKHFEKEGLDTSWAFLLRSGLDKVLPLRGGDAIKELESSIEWITPEHLVARVRRIPGLRATVRGKNVIVESPRGRVRIKARC